MKALLAQLGCRIGDVEGNTARAVDAIRSYPDVDIAVFLELYLSGYTYRDLDELPATPTRPSSGDRARRRMQRRLSSSASRSGRRRAWPTRPPASTRTAPSTASIARRTCS